MQTSSDTKILKINLTSKLLDFDLKIRYDDQ